MHVLDGYESPVEKILARLGDRVVRKRSSGTWDAHCPCSRHRNGDKSPSLGITEGSNGQALIHCLAGGTPEDVLGSIGLMLSDLFPAPGRNGSCKTSVRAAGRVKISNQAEETVSGRIAWAYDYTDENGTLLYQNVRYEPKNFKQRRPKAGGGWVYSTTGIKRVLYRLPEVKEAVALERSILIVEGEKDADRLVALGFTATTSSNATSWRPEFADDLAGADVVLIPDRDKPGDGYRDAIGSSLKGKAKRVRVVTVPLEWHEIHGLDVSDWIDGGGTSAELQAMIDTAPEWAPGIGSPNKPASRIDNVANLLLQTFEPVRWIVDGILPEGICLLAGKPKMGKSWLVLSLCLSTATGGIALGKAQAVKGSVLYLALEDNPRRFQSRIKKLLESEPPDVDVSAFCYLTECPKVTDGGLVVVEDWLRAHPDARLVVVDTLAKIRPTRKKNADSYEEDYTAVQGLKTLADKYRVAVVLVHHLRKAGADDPLDAVSGTLGLTGGVDGAMVLQRERGRADAFLYVSGRDIEEEIELALHWDQQRALWSVSGTAEEFRLSSEQAAVLRVLQESGQPMKPRDIWEALHVLEPNLSQHAVKFRLARMFKDGTIDCAGRGLYVLPVKQPTTRASTLGGGK